MATILERRKKIEKEQRRFERKLIALQEECLHSDGMIAGVCPDCLWGDQDDLYTHPSSAAYLLGILDPFADSEMTGGVQ